MNGLDRVNQFFNGRGDDFQRRQRASRRESDTIPSHSRKCATGRVQRRSSFVVGPRTDAAKRGQRLLCLEPIPKILERRTLPCAQWRDGGLTRATSFFFFAPSCLCMRAPTRQQRNQNTRKPPFRRLKRKNRPTIDRDSLSNSPRAGLARSSPVARKI